MTARSLPRSRLRPRLPASLTLCLLVGLLAGLLLGACSPAEPAASETPDAGGAQDVQLQQPDVVQGDQCASDADCGGDLCVRGACTKACKTPADCASGEACSLDDAGRQACFAPAFLPDMGRWCGADGKCGGGLQCVGTPYSAQAFCTGGCKSDLDCPATMKCGDAKGFGKVCVPRTFCDTCQFDAQCGAGQRCTKMEGGSFCTRACQLGGTDCPRWAVCKDFGGDAGAQCVHSTGTCATTGEPCARCDARLNGGCGDGTCVQTAAFENFCAASCDATCAANTTCKKLPGGAQACVPFDNTCAAKLTPMYEVGAIMSDFAMVGMIDTNGDGLTHDELPLVVRLSDYQEHYKLILINISAVWCSACQQETKDLRNALKNYGESDIVVFQVLFDGATGGSPITMPLLKQWQKTLEPMGTVGMDPHRLVSPWSTQSYTPTNILIEAKTRKVLWKEYGYSKLKLISKLHTMLKKYGAETP